MSCFKQVNTLYSQYQPFKSQCIIKVYNYFKHVNTLNLVTISKEQILFKIILSIILNKTK